MLHRFFIKTPWWAKRVFSDYVWHLPANGKTVYLTFDDGPHPEITPWVLDELSRCGAKATFFCIGNNVCSYPEVYHRILREGHSVGNHTHNHVNGWKTNAGTYLQDVKSAAGIIQTDLFRPPYGKITAAQAKGLSGALSVVKPKVIMWDVLSADFDPQTTPEQCEKNVLKNVRPGSIVVFHDSEKAYPKLKRALPAVLKTLGEEGYEFGKIVMGCP